MILHLFIALCLGVLSWGIFGHFWLGVLLSLAWMGLTWAHRKTQEINP